MSETGTCHDHQQWIPEGEECPVCVVIEQRDNSYKEKDNAYTERNALVALLSKLFPSHLMRHEESDLSWEDDWRNIVCVELPTGQACWHIHDKELVNFTHLVYQENNWDGHSTELKYERIAEVTNHG